MPDLQRDLLQRRRDQRQRRNPRGVPVARDHLAGDRRRLQSDPLADPLLRGRTDVRKHAHGARNLADPQILGGGLEARDVALQLVVPQREFQPERDRFGVDPVRAPDLDGVLELERPLSERRRQRSRTLQDQRRSLFQQQRLRRIDHIVRGHPVVQPARMLGDPGLGHLLGDRRGERDHVMAGFLLDLENPIDVKARVPPQRLSSLLGDLACLGQRLTGGQLDLQPRFKPVLIGENATHLGPCVTGNHIWLGMPRCGVSPMVSEGRSGPRPRPNYLD